MAASGAVADAADGPRPATDLALARIWPNLTSLPLHVAFAVPEAGPARLELIDVAGRSVLALELSSPGAGAFEASLGRDAASTRAPTGCDRARPAIRPHRGS